MPFRKICCCLLVINICCEAVTAQPNNTIALLNKVSLQFSLDQKGIPQYAVYYDGKAVVRPSRMGFVLSNSIVLNEGFQLIKTDSTDVDETWNPVWGEVSSIRNHYKQVSFHLQQTQTPNLLMNIVFKVYEDGVGFRYEFPRQSNLTYFIVASETTQFNLTGDHKTFWIPGDYDTNEQLYTTSRLSEVDAWKSDMVSTGGRALNVPDQYAVQTPLMMKTAEGLYINIHEAALVNFPAMQLHVDRASHSLSANLVPDAAGNKAYLRTPANTPWRTVIVSDKAAAILSSKMILNLNEPSKLENASWVKPMKFIGIWWEMQTNTGSWNYTDRPDSLGANSKPFPNGRHSANTANVKRYIDFASRNGIKGLLVEGWNTGWEAWYGNWNGRHFDFVTPYPDFDVTAIQQYAADKGVEMIMHNETSADAATYDQQMDTAFQFMNRFGYHSVKTGYVGQIIPRGEHHDGQWMVNHYLRSIEKAAKHQVAIDIHEPVRPTGLHRTYPNFIACEAARGNEFNAFSEGSPPEHETILPFTRLMGGPMDYTPGIFKLRNYATGAPGRQMHTTLAKQLALYITMYSPLQMAADIPASYEAHMDAFQFIKDVPTDWDDTKIIEAEPGDYITIARKEKGKNSWFIGAITDENSRIANIPLWFLNAVEKYTVTIYGDGEGADWKTNPEAYKIEQFIVTGKTVLILKLANGGGAAVSVMPATAEQLKKLKMYK
ncbi:MAG: glycoside hydrolase family 97 protein [Chitinophagaceae bacterium]|nr:glycoside hydrolase family 97 protein [Chitinophagaceae bacterium]